METSTSALMEILFSRNGPKFPNPIIIKNFWVVLGPGYGFLHEMKGRRTEGAVVLTQWKREYAMKRPLYGIKAGRSSHKLEVAEIDLEWIVVVSVALVLVSSSGLDRGCASGGVATFCRYESLTVQPL
jgi:hypothetical protein